jgi:hypothetical protein
VSRVDAVEQSTGWRMLRLLLFLIPPQLLFVTLCSLSFGCVLRLGCTRLLKSYFYSDIITNLIQGSCAIHISFSLYYLEYVRVRTTVGVTVALNRFHVRR